MLVDVQRIDIARILTKHETVFTESSIVLLKLTSGYVVATVLSSMVLHLARVLVLLHGRLRNHVGAKFSRCKENTYFSVSLSVG